MRTGVVRECNKICDHSLGRLHDTELSTLCLHGGGGPQVGEVTRLAVVEK